MQGTVVIIAVFSLLSTILGGSMIVSVKIPQKYVFNSHAMMTKKALHIASAVGAIYVASSHWTQLDFCPLMGSIFCLHMVPTLRSLQTSVSQ